MSKRKWIILILIAVSLLAIGSYINIVSNRMVKSQPIIPSDIVWELDYILIEGEKSRPFFGDDAPQVRFVSDTRIIGHDGCNCFCKYQVLEEMQNHKQILTDRVTQTLEGCPVRTIITGTVRVDESGRILEIFDSEETEYKYDQDFDFVKILWSVAEYEILEDELRLYYGEEKSRVMVFFPSQKPLYCDEHLCS